jgi:hypothetical protein
MLLSVLLNEWSDEPPLHEVLQGTYPFTEGFVSADPRWVDAKLRDYNICRGTKLLLWNFLFSYAISDEWMQNLGIIVYFMVLNLLLWNFLLFLKLINVWFKQDCHLVYAQQDYMKLTMVVDAIW